MIDIFGKQLFAEDAEKWLKLCKEQKKEWILKYTTQKDENLIDEFINNPKISKDCKCLDCVKSKENANISKGISEEVATDIKPTNDEVVSKRNSNERPTKTKRTKNK